MTEGQLQALFDLRESGYEVHLASVIITRKGGGQISVEEILANTQELAGLKVYVGYGGEFVVVRT